MNKKSPNTTAIIAPNGIPTIAPTTAPTISAAVAAMEFCRDAVAIAQVADGHLVWGNPALLKLAVDSFPSEPHPVDRFVATLLEAAQPHLHASGSAAITTTTACGLSQEVMVQARQTGAAESEGDAASLIVLVVRLLESATEASQKTLDPVTHLPDRRALDLELHRRFQAPAGPFALLFVDLDGFKLVNDSRGHLAGDRTLREIASRFRKAVREHDLVARYGGDEFVVLVDGVVRHEDLAHVIERLERAAADPLESADTPLAASIGCALSTDGYATPQDMLHAADTQMYASKRSAN